ncbi:MAG TPA: carboxypeptidase M32, partial [Paracoccaceae bacterium]|nr:carboxypeptidase M32 [Paracoccaceae bacterium]
LGVLQDVHWSAGLFGYFPSYSLGNIYAGELFAALGRDLPDLEASIAAGDLAPIVAWLRANIHRLCRLHAPEELIARAVGHPPGVGPLLAYLESKYAALYDL